MEQDATAVSSELVPRAVGDLAVGDRVLLPGRDRLERVLVLQRQAGDTVAFETTRSFARLPAAREVQVGV